MQLYCAWTESTSEAATRTTRAVRDTDVVVPLCRPEVPRVGRTLLSTTSESCVLCVCVRVCVIILPHDIARARSVACSRDVVHMVFSLFEFVVS